MQYLSSTLTNPFSNITFDCWRRDSIFWHQRRPILSKRIAVLEETEQLSEVIFQLASVRSPVSIIILINSNDHNTHMNPNDSVIPQSLKEPT